MKIVPIKNANIKIKKQKARIKKELEKFIK